MCGFIFLKNINDNSYIDLAKKRISNRGGDSEHEIFHNNCYFYHSRLAITGSESTGRQPFETANCIYLFNGEIYNRHYLSSLLNLPYDAETSDTYLVVACLEAFGTDVIECFDGPFAILIYNKKTEKVKCFRDHLGEKPLFKFHEKNVEIISSDLGIISMYKNRPKLSLENCETLIFKGYLDGEKTIFENVFKINKISHTENHFYTKYIGQSDTLHNTLKRILDMQGRNNSALLLSGGIDSLLVGAMLKEKSPECYTFTSGKGDIYDESKMAKQNADVLDLELNIVHSQKIYEKMNFDNTIIKLNEPIGDPSIFNQNIIFNEISKKYKVCFCGTGADEIFHGYLRYRKKFVYKYLRIFAKLVSIEDSQSRLSKLFNSDLYTMEDDRGNYLPNQLFSASDSISFNSGIELRTPYSSILLRQHWKNTENLNLMDFVILKRCLKWLLLSKYHLNRFFLKKRGFTNNYRQSLEFINIENSFGFKSKSALEKLRIAIILRWLEQNGYSKIN